MVLELELPRFDGHGVMFLGFGGTGLLESHAAAVVSKRAKCGYVSSRQAWTLCAVSPVEVTEIVNRSFKTAATRGSGELVRRELECSHKWLSGQDPNRSRSATARDTIDA